MEVDYTLIIPTYNRSQNLKKLLSYLGREKVSFPILVLDSSDSEIRIDNQRIIKGSPLEITYSEYDSTIKPFDKFYSGIRQVKTAFCQLCADDDFLMIQEIYSCIKYLKSHLDVSVVHGYYFMFLECETQGDFDITQILYYTPSNDAKEPLARLRTLFNRYQALTYGIYRTPILERIFQAVSGVEQILSRELLASALAVVHGKVIRLPVFTHGRSQGASQSYQFWHPLEWLMRSPKALFNEYKIYKEILIRELVDLFNISSDYDDIERKIDLIHMDYLIHHTPLDAYEFLMDSIINGKTVDEVWQSHAIQIPLIHAAHSREIKEAVPLPDRIKAKLKRMFLSEESKKVVNIAALEQIKTERRTYRLHKNFTSPGFEHDFFVKLVDIEKLTVALDNYY